MSRLIDADDLTVDYIVPSTTNNTECYRYISKEQIDNALTVDALNVVRCKDCKHYVPVLDTEGGGECTDVRYELFTTPEDYCAWGERKVSL